MCTECDSWRALAEHAWDEVFRLMEIARALQTQLPPEARGPVEATLQAGATDPVRLKRNIELFSTTCEQLLSDPIGIAALTSHRRGLLEEAARRGEALRDKVIRPSLQHLTTAPEPTPSAGVRYFQMIDGVTDEWIGSLRQQQGDWKGTWALYRPRQAQIDRINRDVLAGTPFLKAFI